MVEEFLVTKADASLRPVLVGVDGDDSCFEAKDEETAAREMSRVRTTSVFLGFCSFA